MTSPHLAPANRLNYSGDLTPVIEDICKAYAIGKLRSFSVIGVGYEDCNVIIETDQNRFVAKMFAKTRTLGEIDRYANVMREVVEAGVNHPELIAVGDGKLIYTTNGLSLILMRFIEGATFYDLDRAPTRDELKVIIEQAAKINRINYKPSFLFDSWAIPNIKILFDQVREHLAPEDLALVEQVLEKYETIPEDDLPHAFVHGDIIKTNTIKGDDGKIYLVDFSVANWYPRIQELAVIAANLLHDDKQSLTERCELVANEYSKFTPLEPLEHEHLHSYALAGVAMEFMGAHQEKHIKGNHGEENDYWLNLGREGLRRELS